MKSLASTPLPHPMGRLKIPNKIEILARKETSNVLLKTMPPVPAKPGGTMDEDDEGATLQKSNKGLEDLLDLLAGLKTKEDLHLERPGDVERLADIIHAAIIKLHGMKKPP